VELVTHRLILREFVESDWRDVLRYQSDPRYLRYYDWTGRTEDDVTAFVRMFLEQQREEPRRKFQLALVLREGGRLIGNCGIRVNAPELREANIGYEVDPEHWGHGYATEAAREILRFGFQDLAMHRIWSWCVADNRASARVLEKLGMRREGHLREKEYYKGRWWDHLLYALLDHEWASIQAGQP
jgi:RimJ/RimL family protein N-acetyltransferase